MEMADASHGCVVAFCYVFIGKISCSLLCLDEFPCKLLSVLVSLMIQWLLVCFLSTECLLNDRPHK